MSEELTQERKMSLFQIETELAELIAYRETEGLSTEEQATADGLIRAYVEREIAKVDGIRSYLRHCEVMFAAAKEEEQLQAERKKAWAGRLTRLKDFCKQAMEAAGVKRLEGRTGNILLKGNGGRQPVEITDSRLIPAEYREVSGSIPADLWYKVLELAEKHFTLQDIDRLGRSMVTDTPRLSAIAEELALPCKSCGGTGHGLNGFSCESCGGTGKRGVPGAALAPRGSHIEVK